MNSRASYLNFGSITIYIFEHSVFFALTDGSNQQKSAIVVLGLVLHYYNITVLISNCMLYILLHMIVLDRCLATLVKLTSVKLVE